jgi:transposase
VSTLRHVLKEGFCFNMPRLTFVMDKGFYSAANITSMYNYGYHFIVSMTMGNKTARDATEILDIYRDKDGVEKVFDDIKNSQDGKRLGVQSRETMEGKMFVVFLASILMSEIRQRMKACDGKEVTMELLRRSLDKITTSRIAYGNSRKRRELNSIVSLTQRKYLSSLLKVEKKEVEKVLFKILF